VTVPLNGDLDTLDFKTQSEEPMFTSVTDWRYTGSRNDFTWANVKAQGSTSMVRDQVADADGNLSESASTTADHNWQISASKSFTNCGGASSGFVKCPRPDANADLETRMKGGINLHWFRNFRTADAPGYDLQLDGAQDKGEEAETFAYLWNWFTPADYPAKKPFKECLNAQSTPAYNTVPVTEAAWTKVYVAPEPVVPDNNNNNKDDDDDDENKKDFSISNTVSVTALLSAVYALAF